MPRAGRSAVLALGALGAVAFALRCAYLIGYDEDVDALRFVLGVERFDVARLRPHAPYYPVLVAAAKVLTTVGASPRLALGLVNALSGAVVVVATALLARETLSRRAAVVAGLLALASPFLWLSSQKLLSDMAGTACFTVALWLCARARRFIRAGAAAEGLRTTALVLLGGALGVRLSYFPIALACTAVVAMSEGSGRAWWARLRDLCTGVVLWLVPLVLMGGPRALVQTTWIQFLGHFGRWGGSVLTVSSPVERLNGILWGLWAHVLGGAWWDTPVWRALSAPLLGVLLVRAARSVGSLRAWACRHPELVVSAAGYFVWAALGQNTAFKPRHWMPLAPLLVVVLAAGTMQGGARSHVGLAAMALLWGVWFVDGALLVRAHQSPSPAAALVRFLRDHGSNTHPVLTCDLERMITEGAPGQPVVRLATPAALVRALEAIPAEGALLTSECLVHARSDPLAARGLSHRVVFTQPRSRYLDPTWNDLALMAITPAAVR